MDQQKLTINLASRVAWIACFCGLSMSFIEFVAAQGIGTPGFIQTPVGPVPIVPEIFPVNETKTSDEDQSSPQEEVPRAELTGLLEAQLELTYSVNAQKYDQALPLAERVTKLIKVEFGEKSSETAGSISNFAEIQRRAGFYEEAGISFLASVELFREIEGTATSTAIVPLIGLGVSYHGLGNYPQALAVLEEARSINRRWLRGSSRFDDAHSYYIRAISIIRAADEPQSVLLVEPLRGIANTYREQRRPLGAGINALGRALRILRSQSEPDKFQIAEILRDIGDWHTAFSRVGPTGNEYREAWSVLTELEDGITLQQRWFYDPSDVLKTNPSTLGLADPEEPGATQGYVLVSFDVTPTGQATNISVLESEPSEFKDEATALSIQRSRFRPRMLNGELISAKGITRRYTFFYIPLSGQDGQSPGCSQQPRRGTTRKSC